MENNPENPRDIDWRATLLSSLAGSLGAAFTLYLAGGLGLWSWMSNWERRYMLSSLRHNLQLGQEHESQLLQLVQLGERSEILPGTSTLPTWKLRGFLVLLAASLTANIALIIR
jgi:hypothetical protein